MQALEFETIIEDNKILIPREMKSNLSHQKHVRVIVLIEDKPSQEAEDFQQLTREQFLNGYAESDAIYDNV